MPRFYNHKNLPYCYGFNSETATEIIFGRDYQPLARRNFHKPRRVEIIDWYPAASLKMMSACIPRRLASSPDVPVIV